MNTKKLIAGWNKICPGCNIARKYPDSFIGKKVRGHWEKGCPAHDAYVEIYGAKEPTSKRAAKAVKAGAGQKAVPAGKSKVNKQGKK